LLCECFFFKLKGERRQNTIRRMLSEEVVAPAALRPHCRCESICAIHVPMDVPHKLWMAYRALFLPWGCPMADKEHDMSSPNTNLTLEQHVLGISGKPLQRNAFFHNRSEHMESGRPLNKQRRTYDSGKPLQPDTHHFYEL
jgi:hypothetical protein